jgi:dihydroorotate dehydrogenase (fumarate)
MIDMTSRYLGMDLRCPLMASPGPVTDRFDALLRLEEAGAGAVVLPSLFEEQIAHEAMDVHALLDSVEAISAEAAGFFPDMASYNAGPANYLDYVEAARDALDIPVIASLNGASPGGWVRYAKQIEEAGAHALELNVYYVAADPFDTSANVEQRYVELVSDVREAVSIPVAVKVGPYFSAFGEMARRLVTAGADGLVLFNRFLMPDIDLESLEVAPSLQLSTPYESRLSLRWIAVLRDRVRCSLAATSGVHSAEEAVKLLLVGADAVQMQSALIKHGPEYLRLILDGLAVWLEENGYESVEQAKGSLAAGSSPDPAAFERANYMQALASYSTRTR